MNSHLVRVVCVSVFSLATSVGAVSSEPGVETTEQTIEAPNLVLDCPTWRCGYNGLDPAALTLVKKK